VSGPGEPDAEAPATGAQPAAAGFAGNPWRDAPSARRSAVPAPRREQPTTGGAGPTAVSPADTSPSDTNPAAAPPPGSELVATEPGTSYADLIRRLAGAEADLARRRTAVHAWFARQQARAEAEVARTAQRVAEAESALGSAQAAVEFTEAETARLWQILAGRLRLRDPAQLGPPPGPDDSGEPVAEHPAHLLDRVRETLDRVRPAKRRPAARLPLLLLAVIVLLVGIGYAAYKLAS
jgi:hypothetical protein